MPPKHPWRNASAVILDILEVAEIQIVLMFIDEWIRKETLIAELISTTAKDQKSLGENLER